MDVLFEWADETDLISPDNLVLRTIRAHWNYDQDPLFGDRAASTTINLLIDSADAVGIQEGHFVKKGSCGERYKVIERSETCGDGKLTVLRLTRAKI